MTKPHKHADILRAIADGKEVQCRFPGEHSFFTPALHNPVSHPDLEWRIKPEPKPDIVTYVKATVDLALSKGIYVCLSKTAPSNNLRLTFDSQTRKLKAAEVIE